MLKRILLVLFLLLIVTCGNSFGTFIDKGSYVIDKSLGYAWYSNLDDFHNMTYDEQLAAADSLNSGSGTFGYQNWRLAKTSEVVQMFTQWKNTLLPFDYFDYTSSFPNGPYEDYFWDARTADHDAVLIKYIADHSGIYGFEEPIKIRGFSDSISTYEISAWVVAEIPAPEPATLMLFGSGIIILLGVLRKTH